MKKAESNLAHYFRELRTHKGETLHQVSKGTDIDSPMLSKIERGYRMPTLEQLKKLCKYFNVCEENLKIMHTAEKIIKEYGINETTYEAVKMVEEQLNSTLNKPKSR